MINNDQYIINKVFVEVNTNSKKVANTFKNSVGHFLQEEVFPKIESYLASAIEISTKETQQISKITLDVNLDPTNKLLDLKSTREEITTQILDKLAAVIEKPAIHDVEIISKSKADAFFYFLQNGTNAWWTHSKTEQEFSKQVLFQITETNTFETRFLKVIQNIQQRTRLINQFFNDDLKILFLGIRNKPEGFTEVLSSISSNNFRNNFRNITIKKELWNTFSKAVLNKQPLLIIKSMEEEIFHTTTPLLNEKKAAFLKVLIAFYSEKTVFSEKLRTLSTYKNEILKHVLKSEEALSLKNNITENSATVPQEGNLKTAASTTIQKASLKKNASEEKKPDSTNKQTQNLSDSAILLDGKTENIQDGENAQNKENVTTKTTDKNKLIATNSEKNTDANLKTTEINKEVSKEKELLETASKKKALVNLKTPEINNKVSEAKKTLKPTNEVLEKEVTTETIKDVSYSKEPAVNESIACIVKNAGLILLHPFLKQFFKSCGLLNEKNQLLKPAEAVHVLHYLATKKEQQLESNLVFEKFLCNVPIHQSISREIIISDAIKGKSEELLQSIVENWGILKNASTDLVRYEFLQRSGKLDLTKDNPHITVERKTQDILLDKLPWNYSMCKLPWMNTLIFTDW